MLFRHCLCASVRPCRRHRVFTEHEAKLKKLFKHDGDETDAATQDVGLESVGSLDYRGFKDNAHHIFDDTKKVVHEFHKSMEEKTMIPIFQSAGTSANRDVDVPILWKRWASQSFPPCLPQSKP